MKRAKGQSYPPDAPLDREASAPCALCGRSVGRTSRHHIIPRSEGGTLTVDLCAPCHKTLHSFFTNRTLAAEFSTLDAIRRDPDIQSYLRWVRRQADRRIQVRARRDRR